MLRRTCFIRQVGTIEGSLGVFLAHSVYVPEYISLLHSRDSWSSFNKHYIHQPARHIMYKYQSKINFLSMSLSHFTLSIIGSSECRSSSSNGSKKQSMSLSFLILGCAVTTSITVSVLNEPMSTYKMCSSGHRGTRCANSEDGRCVRALSLLSPRCELRSRMRIRRCGVRDR
jgi:hypothetical protein